MSELPIDPKTQEMLQAMQMQLSNIQLQMRLIMRTVMNRFEIKNGDLYVPNPDFSKMILLENKDEVEPNSLTKG